MGQKPPVFLVSLVDLFLLLRYQMNVLFCPGCCFCLFCPHSFSQESVKLPYVTYLPLGSVICSPVGFRIEISRVFRCNKIEAMFENNVYWLEQFGHKTLSNLYAPFCHANKLIKQLCELNCSDQMDQRLISLKHANQYLFACQKNLQEMRTFVFICLGDALLTSLTTRLACARSLAFVWIASPPPCSMTKLNYLCSVRFK